MNWDLVDWAALERMRDVFLRRSGAEGPYWGGRPELESYDFTFGRRIAWKWSSVLEQLNSLGWTPPARTIVDWGCGSGIAARALLAQAAGPVFDQVVLWDHSPTATGFARDAIASRHPEINIRINDPADLPDGEAFVLVVSHVLNELDPAGREVLLALARRACAVLWVEPGTYDDSRALIEVRNDLRKHFHCWLPCPHDGACGLLAPANERHWCHHFARPPTEAFTESGWTRFGQRLGVDLRSLPYSCLVLDQRLPERNANAVRILGRPRAASGVMKILRCRADDVSEVQLQKRDSKSLWKALEKGRHDRFLAWTEDAGSRIQRSDEPF